jgi:hypothetical protein
MGLPGDVVDVCLFLASPLSSYVSGACVLMHGGGEKPAFMRSCIGSESWSFCASLVKTTAAFPVSKKSHCQAHW